MNNYQYHDVQPARPGLGAIWGRAAVRLWDQASNRRGLIFGLILVVALVSFEIFNFSTTEYSLTDLLGTLEFAGLRWATILAIAFCGIDFAGLARLFTPERNTVGSSTETWYLIAAWFLGATMNAMMTWWAVSLAMINSGHQIGNEILGREQLLAYVPVFVAALVWITRILIIGTFSVAGDRLFSQAEAVLTQVRNEVNQQRPRPVAATAPAPKPAFVAPRPVQPQPMPQSQAPARVIGGSYEEDDEPVYVPIDQARSRSPESTRPVDVPRPAESVRPIVPPAASIRPSTPYRPAEPYRPATRPAPKPQPAQAFSGRNGENGNGNHNGNGHSNGNGNGNGNGHYNGNGNSKF